MNAAIHKELEALATELGALQTAVTHINNAAAAAQSAVDTAAGYQRVAEVHGRLSDRTERLTKRIETIDFPERFEKLGSALSGISGSIIVVSSRIDAAERSLQKALGELAGNQDAGFDGLTDALVRRTKPLLIVLIATAALVAADIVITLAR